MLRAKVDATSTPTAMQPQRRDGPRITRIQVSPAAIVPISNRTTHALRAADTPEPISPATRFPVYAEAITYDTPTVATTAVLSRRRRSSTARPRKDQRPTPIAIRNATIGRYARRSAAISVVIGTKLDD